MKWIYLLFALGLVIGLSFVVRHRTPRMKRSKEITRGAYAPVAVLELFTSEGCSSCPPADRLLPELTQPDSNIFSLSYHVDYWNRLGWKDSFSSAAYSGHQQAYGSQFHLESIYTPQLVVNGEYELVGSNRQEAINAIKKARAANALVAIHINTVTVKDGRLIADCSLEGDFRNTTLRAALIQKTAVVDVRAGENAGARLSHTNIVLAIATQPATARAALSLDFPSSIEKSNWELLVYAQQVGGKITGANRYTP